MNGQGPIAGLEIRAARPGDIGAIAAIYAHHVATGTATFELEPPDAAEMRRRHDELTGAGYPWLAAVDPPGRVLGYAYAGPYRTRPAYRHTVEDSIYIDPGAAGRRVGGRLLAALIEGCEARGYRQVVAVIGGSDNAASIALHARAGFVHVGCLPAVGRKFGRWLDTVFMQRALGPGAGSAP